MQLGDIKARTREELVARFAQWDQPAYRVDQVLNWLYTHRVTGWEAMSNLPQSLRRQLADSFTLRIAQLVRLQGAHDATRKFLWRLHDGALIESVLIPANPALYGEPSDRQTLCISTQVGCAYGCKFCASGLGGWKRNLGSDEIIEQVLAVERWHAQGLFKESTAAAEGGGQGGQAAGTATGAVPAPAQGGSRPAREQPDAKPDAAPRPFSVQPPRLVSNVVVMGMGEPLANYDNLLGALRILNAPWGGGIGARKITVSTSGLAPEIRRLADEPLQLRLAISLHAATDPVRNRLMPVNRKYPLGELIAACQYYQARKGRMITFEYVLIEGVNDDLSEAGRLAVLARRLHAKVNLIPYNQVEGLPWNRPSRAVQEAFLNRVVRAGASATLRAEKGHEIDAACGQLRLKTEKEMQQAEAALPPGRH
jgi:23S rRNA (adenine2503-C2)-methyltransferase